MSTALFLGCYQLCFYATFCAFIVFHLVFTILVPHSQEITIWFLHLFFSFILVVLHLPNTIFGYTSFTICIWCLTFRCLVFVSTCRSNLIFCLLEWRSWWIQIYVEWWLTSWWIEKDWLFLPPSPSPSPSFSKPISFMFFRLSVGLIGARLLRSINSFTFLPGLKPLISTLSLSWLKCMTVDSCSKMQALNTDNRTLIGCIILSACIVCGNQFRWVKWSEVWTKRNYPFPIE